MIIKRDKLVNIEFDFFKKFEIRHVLLQDHTEIAKVTEMEKATKMEEKKDEIEGENEQKYMLRGRIRIMNGY